MLCLQGCALSLLCASVQATYVWLPLFIDPANARHVRVVWREEWRLDQEDLSPF